MRDIEEQRRRLEKAERDYADLTAMRTSLEKEIGDYRNMLDGNFAYLSICFSSFGILF